MKIAVIGTGYVGLVTGTCFAESGNEVLCMDIDPEKVAAMQAGKVPIYEPQLENLFARNLRDKRLNFTTDLALAVDFAEIIFLALPTPSGEDGSADLSYVLGVAEKIAPLLKKYTVIVNKSTVPVGTAKKVFEVMKNKANASFDVISNPEFLREGFAVEDFMKPDRIVIGTSSALAQEKMRKLYAPFVRQGNPILFMDEKSAEITKYAANAFLATKITFMNEIANYCETVGADVEQVRQGMGTDTRIGKRFLFAGIGYGGSCFPKDVKALIKSGKEVQMPFEIASAVEKVNQSQKTLLVRKMEQYYAGNLAGKTFALWGLAFKPETDDIREAPSLYIIDELLRLGAKVQAFDPEAMHLVQHKIGEKIHYAKSAYEALQGADALVIATEWNAFRNPDFELMSKQLKHKVIFDGRNLYHPEDMKQLGYYYNSIGRKTITT